MLKKLNITSPSVTFALTDAEGLNNQPLASCFPLLLFYHYPPFLSKYCTSITIYHILLFIYLSMNLFIHVFIATFFTN